MRKFQFHYKLLSILALFVGGLMFLFGFQPHLSNEQFLKTAMFPEPETLDPRKLRLAPHCSLYLALFEGLTRIDAENKIELAQANSVEISQERTLYTFHLGEHYWSHSERVTAEDFAESWEDLLSPGSSSRHGYLLDPIKNAVKVKKGELPLSEVGIRVIDDRTLQVELEYPFPDFLNVLAHPALVPIHHRNENTFPQWAHKTHIHRFVSNGPFVVRQWGDQTLTLIPNPYYQGRASCMETSGIEIAFIGCSSTLKYLFEKGHVNFLASTLAPVPSFYYRDLKEKGYLIKYPEASTCLIAFNLRRTPFDNQKIRRALSLSMHRKQLTHYILDLGENPAFGLIPPELKEGRDRKFFVDNQQESAHQLLEEGLSEIGWTRSQLEKQMSLAFDSALEINEKIALEIAQRWKINLGISVSLQPKDRTSISAEMIEKKHNLCLLSLNSPYASPYAFLRIFQDATNMTNIASWQNERFNEILAESHHARSSNQQLDLLEEAEKILMEEMPVAPIYFKVMYILNGKNTKHFDLNILGGLDFSTVGFKEKTM